jgi:hypothetical protein
MDQKIPATHHNAAEAGLDQCSGTSNTASAYKNINHSLIQHYRMSQARFDSTGLNSVCVPALLTFWHQSFTFNSNKSPI